MRRIWSLVALLLVAGCVALPWAVRAEGPHRVALIVVHGDGHVTTHCISFSEDEISGGEVLRRAGLNVRFTGYAGFGAGVCAIDGEGCPLENQDCFCQCPGTACNYWSYWHWKDGRWLYSQVGAEGYRVRDGDIEGWIWGDAKSPPPAMVFEQICAPPPTATPTPMPAPTNTAVPTRMPTHTALPPTQVPPTSMPPATSVPTNAPTSVPPATSVPTNASTSVPPTATSQPGLTPTKAATPKHTATLLPAASATPTASATATAQPSPTASATLASSVTAVPATPTEATRAGPTSTPLPASERSAPLGQYALFGAMAVLLVGAFWFLNRRARR